MKKKNSYIIEDSFDPQSRFENIEHIKPNFWKTKKLEDLSSSEEHTSELQSHSEISHAAFCLKKQKFFFFSIA